MRYPQTAIRIGPERTPQIIKTLMLITSVATILSALFDRLFTRVLGLYSPQDLLSLSWGGLERFFLWQPLTHLFVHHANGSGLDFGILITLLFHMLMLWIFGSALVEIKGEKPFLKLYLLSGITAGLVGVGTMVLTGQYSILSGCSSSLLALFVVWTMMNAESEVLLFFVFPVKAKWLLAGLVGAIFLIDLSQWNLVGLAHSFSAIGFGYAFGSVAWGLTNPFYSPFQSPFSQLIDKFKSRSKTVSIETTIHKKSKIIDFRTGEPILDDDAFMDAMLEKITEHGEESLSRDERKRMEKISKAKAKNGK